MSTILNNAPAEHLFSSQLEDLVWASDAQEITVQLSRTGDQAERFYSAKLKSFDGQIRLWEVRELVEEYMRLHELACMDLLVVWIEVVNGIGYTNGTGAFVIYNAFDTSLPATWVHEHFLSTLQQKTLPNPGESETLSFINLDYRLSTPEFKVAVEFLDGSGQTVVGLQPDEPVYAPKGLARVSIDMDDLADRLAATLDGEFVILQVLVKVGDRYMLYSRPRPGEEPRVVLAFLNAFNALEWCRLDGTTTVKTANNAKSAMVSRRLRKYDHDLDVTHEVTTAPLIHDVARWLSQLTASTRAWLLDGTEIIIEGDSHEFSDEEDKMTSVKFSWRRTDKRDKMRHDLTAGGIFNLVYNDIYA